MSLRLLLDEMYPIRLAEQLRDREVDTVAVLEIAALPSASDLAVLARAHADSRAVVTENIKDFSRLVRSQPHSVLVLLPARRWSRNDSGLTRIADALCALDGDRPGVHWLRPVTGSEQ